MTVVVTLSVDVFGIVRLVDESEAETLVTVGVEHETVDVALFPEEPLPFQLVSDDIDQPPPETLYPPTEPLDHDTEIFFEPISEPFFSSVALQAIDVGVPATVAVKVNVPLCSPLEKLVLLKVALAVPVPVPPMVDLSYVTVAFKLDAPSKLLGVLQLYVIERVRVFPAVAASAFSGATNTHAVSSMSAAMKTESVRFVYVLTVFFISWFLLKKIRNGLCAGGL